jgi:hypothetical protein
LSPRVHQAGVTDRRRADAFGKIGLAAIAMSRDNTRA